MLDTPAESKTISFKQGVESLQTVLTEIKKSHPELSLKVQAVQLEFKKLQADQLQIDEEHSFCQEQLNTTGQQLAEAKAIVDVESLQKELAAFPEQLESPKIFTFISLQTKLEALQKSCQEHQTKLAGELRQGLEARQKQLEKARSEWQQSVSHQQKLNQETHTQLKTELRQLEERISKRLAELTQRVNHLETWAESAKGILNELKDADLKTRSQIQNLQAQLSQLLAEQKLHHTQRAEYQAEVQELQAQLAKAPTKEEIAQLETRLKAVEEQLAELSSQKLNAQPLNAKLEALQKLQEDKLKTLASNQRQEIETQQKRLAQLKSLQSELSQQVDKQNQQNQAQLQALKGEIRNLEERFQKELSGIKKEVKEIKTEITRVETKVDKVETKVDGLEAKFDAQDPRYTVATKILKLRTAILEDKFITDELKYYVAPNGEGQQGLGDHQPLQEWVKSNFLDAKAEPKVLLLQGVAGAGKSTFNRYLMHQLWQDEAWKTFKPGMPAPKAYLPIFIPLGSPQTQPSQLLKYLNDLPELVDDLTDREINVLKTEYQLLLIVDGYDEIPGNQKLNLYDSNQLQQYPGIKLVIGCRTQRAQELSETDVFIPHTVSGQAQYQYFKRRHVSPFNDEQIQDYISKYLAQNQSRTDVVLWKNSRMYLDQLNKLPDFKALLTTPFALLMSIEVLPGIVEAAEKAAKNASESKGDSKSQESKESKISHASQFTRAKLYDVFMDHWFKRQAEKARQVGDTTNAKVLIQHYRQFCFKLAEGLRAAGITAVQYPFGGEALFETDLFADKPKEAVDPKGPRGPWVKKLFGSEDEAMLRARKGAPLTVATGNYYQFIHASFIDYFSTTAMVAQVQLIETIKPEENKRETQILQDTASSSLEILLGDKPMSRDQLYLLADRIQQEPALQTQLFKIIEKTKQEAKLALAASNAISALNAAGVNLSGYDFRGIRIPGADLSGALLHGTQFQDADLSDVNFQSAWLAEAKLQQAKLKNIRFGEQMYIGAEGKIKACGYSPNGYWLAIVTGDVIEVYEALSRRLERRYTGHTSDVSSISWDQASKRLASGSHDKTVRVWEVSTGKELCCLKGHTDAVNSVSWDQQEERLVSGGGDATVRVWDVSTGKELHVLKGHSRGVTSVSWDQAGEHLASGSEDWTVRVWEVSTGKELCCLKKLGRVNSINWDRQGKRLAAGGHDGAVRIWEVSTGKELRCLKGHEAMVNNVCWDQQGERVASVSLDRTVRVWEVSTGKELCCLRGHTEQVTAVSWDQQGVCLASGSDDKTVRVWKVSMGKELHCFQRHGHTNNVSSVSWDPKGERLASGGYDNTVCVWEMSTGTELRRLKGHTWAVASISWDQQGERLASGSFDYGVRVWEVLTGKELHCFKGHSNFVNSISWDPYGQRLASGSNDETVRVWEVSTGKELRCFQGNMGEVNSVSWDPKGERLASGSSDNTVRVWEVSSGKELQCFKQHKWRVWSVSWDPKGERLASGSNDKTVRVWEVSTGKEVSSLEGHTHGVTSVCWDQAGKHLISGSWDRTVRVWEVSTGKEIHQLLLPQPVSQVAITSSNSSTMTLAVAFDKAIGCFELIAKGDTYTSHLKWLATDGTVGLHLAGLNLTDAQGLSPDNDGLLKQRGAIGKPADTPSLEAKENKSNTRGDSKDEAKLASVKGFAASAAQLGTFAGSAESPAKASTTAPVAEFKPTPQRG